MDARSIEARPWLALALLAACGGGARSGSSNSSGGGNNSSGAAARPGAPDPGLANRATPGDATAPTAPVPPLPGGGERAYLTDDRGLVEVSTAGGSQVLVPTAGWCNVDARANVVWFLAEDGLHAFDLADRRARTITRGTLGELEVIIDWGREQLGGESAILFDVGIALKLAGPGKPALEMVMGCDGDRMFYCYEEGLKKPLARVVELQRLAGTIQLVDPDYVAQLAARGKRASLWSPPAPRTPPRRKPVVDVKRCEDRSRCGALIEVPASPLWLVHTYNGRGDYYHENRELWDPATGKYVHLAGGKLVWSKDAPPVPNNETDYRGMRISPLGVLSYQGAVFDSARVYYTPSDPEYGGGSSCGWAGGGWRVDGPTDGFHH